MGVHGEGAGSEDIVGCRGAGRRPAARPVLSGLRSQAARYDSVGDEAVGLGIGWDMGRAGDGAMQPWRAASGA